MNTIEPHLNVGAHYFDNEFWDDDSSDDYEYCQYVTAEIRRLTIEKQRQREKWLKFEYPQDQGDQYDPADGDVRGNYKEIDKRRKKTWHSKGANPANRFDKFEKWYKTAKKRQCRYYQRKYTSNLIKAPQLVDKYHHGTKIHDSNYCW